MSLKNKTLFVTGASRGIGLAIALRAARDGANVVIAAKTAEAHPKLPGTIYSAAAEIEAAGGKALPLLVWPGKPGYVEAVRAAGARVSVTILGERDNEATMREVIRMGARIIETDYPEVAARVRAL